MDTQEQDKLRDDILRQLDDKLYGRIIGFHWLVTIKSGGKTADGVECKPHQIEVVVLEDDGAFLAYRYFDDLVWLVGNIEDVADYWVAFLDDD